MIALVTDSNAQLPDSLRARYRVEVVPLGIVIEGEAHREGVDLSVEEFYDALRAGAQVSTSAPSPGDFAEVYAGLAAAGASAVLSVHLGSNLSGTVNAARLAAAAAAIPVEIVDTQTASFAVGCAVWAAGDELGHSGDLEAAARAARGVAERVGNVFIAGALDLAMRGGRLGADVTADLPVLALEGSQMRQVGQVATTEEAIEAMVAYLAAWRRQGELRVGVGDAGVPAVAAELAARIATTSGVAEVVPYQIGPSVAAHTGLGTVGAVFYDAGG